MHAVSRQYKGGAELSSGLTQTADSQSRSDVRICADGTDSMRLVERVGQKAA